MQEIVGNLWDYYGKPNTVVCITINGTLKKDGSVVMGKGCAYEAKLYIPGIAYDIGKHIKKYGLCAHYRDSCKIMAFPVKFAWYEKADLNLIKESAQTLCIMACMNPTVLFILPRPGCGNGGRTWEEVKGVLEEVGLPDNVLIITKA